MTRYRGRRGHGGIRGAQEPPKSEVWELVKDAAIAISALLFAGFLIVLLASINW